MGWTGTHVPKGTKTIDALHGEWAYDPEFKNRILKEAVVGSVYYAAVRRKDGDGVFALVVVTQRNSKDYFNFSYKEMSEDMHPYYYDCPAAILDLLTEPINDEAAEWRRICRERQARGKVNKGKLTDGAIIKLPEPLRFVGVDGEYDTFQVTSLPGRGNRRRTRYMAMKDGQAQFLCTIPHMKHRQFEILATA